MTKARAGKMAAITLMAIASFLVTSFYMLPSNPSYAAESASNIAVVDFQMLISKHPDMAKAQEEMQAAVNQAAANFETESAKMSEQGKRDYHNQLQQMLDVKQQGLVDAITTKVVAAVKAVADSKGVKIVVDKRAAVYGSMDLTEDVLKKITSK